jgi:hypothetical protein
MNKDLPTRLREQIKLEIQVNETFALLLPEDAPKFKLLREAADEIERLRADAVLAELGLTQAEPVGEVWVKVIPENWGYTPREEITKVRWTGGEPPAGTKLYAAPQPQPQASAEDVALVDRAVRSCPFTDWEYAAWQRIRASLMSATPTTGVGRE